MTVDLLSLSWDSHRSILSVFEKLLDSNSLVDCTLTAEGQYLKAHKVILSACSPYFELLFSVENDKHPIIFFKDVKFQELKAVIDFVYRGQVNVPENRLAAFLETAESLQINGIGSPEHSKTEKRGATESLQTCEKEGHSSPVHKKRKKDALDNPQESVEENSKSSKDVNSTISSCHESTFQLPRPSAALLSSTVNAPSMSQSKKVDVLPDKLKNKELVTCDERVFESAVTSLTTDKSDLPPVASVDIKTEPVGDDEELEENECKSEPVSDSAFDNSNVDSCDFQLETESDMGRLLSNSNLTPQFVEFNPVQGTSQEAASKNSHLVSQTSDSLGAVGSSAESPSASSSPVRSPSPPMTLSWSPSPPPLALSWSSSSPSPSPPPLTPLTQPPPPPPPPSPPLTLSWSPPPAQSLLQSVSGLVWQSAVRVPSPNMCSLIPDAQFPCSSASPPLKMSSTVTQHPSRVSSSLVEQPSTVAQTLLRVPSPSTKRPSEVAKPLLQVTSPSLQSRVESKLPLTVLSLTVPQPPIKASAVGQSFQVSSPLNAQSIFSTSSKVTHSTMQVSSHTIEKPESKLSPLIAMSGLQKSSPLLTQPSKGANSVRQVISRAVTLHQLKASSIAIPPLVPLKGTSVGVQGPSKISSKVPQTPVKSPSSTKRNPPLKIALRVLKHPLQKSSLKLPQPKLKTSSTVAQCNSSVSSPSIAHSTSNLSSSGAKSTRQKSIPSTTQQPLKVSLPVAQIVLRESLTAQSSKTLSTIAQSPPKESSALKAPRARLLLLNTNCVVSQPRTKAPSPSVAQPSLNVSSAGAPPPFGASSPSSTQPTSKISTVKQSPSTKSSTAVALSPPTDSLTAVAHSTSREPPTAAPRPSSESSAPSRPSALRDVGLFRRPGCRRIKYRHECLDCSVCFASATELQFHRALHHPPKMPWRLSAESLRDSRKTPL